MSSVGTVSSFAVATSFAETGIDNVPPDGHSDAAHAGASAVGFSDTHEEADTEADTVPCTPQSSSPSRSPPTKRVRFDTQSTGLPPHPGAILATTSGSETPVPTSPLMNSMHQVSKRGRSFLAAAAHRLSTKN